MASDVYHQLPTQQLQHHQAVKEKETAYDGNCENEVTGEDIVLVIKKVDNMIFEESKHGSFSVFGRTHC